MHNLENMQVVRVQRRCQYGCFFENKVKNGNQWCNGTCATEYDARQEQLYEEFQFLRLHMPRIKELCEN